MVMSQQEPPKTQDNNTQPSTTKKRSVCAPPEPLPAQPIIDTILADVNALIPNFTSLVSSYRLLVGAAEEINRIPTVCPDVFERAVRRFDNSGTLIDILLDLLCCKIYYSSEFLSVTGAPVDLIRLLSNRCNPCDQSHQTADQIVTLEVLRQALSDCLKTPGFPLKQVVCPYQATKPIYPADNRNEQISANIPETSQRRRQI